MAKPSKAEAAEESMTYEQALAELEALIERIERGEIGLEESLAEYRRGAALLTRCRAILDTAEQQIEQLTADGSED
ncbi:MAG: exodeoxyribonuclease VII small subunit [Planctomycetes bacterium]|nr:exodeoxyribonuclease VII small subunit [Planctomycetota bacterium]